MSAGAISSRQSTFFMCLSQADRSTLLLDYDGTLAPFRSERELRHALPMGP